MGHLSPVEGAKLGAGSPRTHVASHHSRHPTTSLLPHISFMLQNVWVLRQQQVPLPLPVAVLASQVPRLADLAHSTRGSARSQAEGIPPHEVGVALALPYGQHQPRASGNLWRQPQQTWIAGINISTHTVHREGSTQASLQAKLNITQVQLPRAELLPTRPVQVVASQPASQLGIPGGPPFLAQSSQASSLSTHSSGSTTLSFCTEGQQGA